MEEKFSLIIPSSNQTNIKLISSFMLAANSSVSFTLDLDVRKSITASGPSNNLFFKLRPTMRLINNVDVAILLEILMAPHA
jgi:hypothetical protein